MPRNSPVIFWFLLAATLSLDAVSISWIFVQDFAPASGTLYIALAFAELSALATWALLRHDFGVRWLVPFLAGIAVGCTMMLAQQERTPELEIFFTYTGLMWAHTFVAMLILWLLQPTSILYGFVGHSNRRWQYSVMHLLVAMTVLAVFCVVLQRGQLLVDERSNVLTLCLANTVLLVLVLLAVQQIQLWPFRLAVALSAALSIAAICSSTSLAFANQLNSYAFNSIQAIVLWSWIEVLSATRVSKPALAEGPPLQSAEQ
jgi:hypothetical protein